MDTNELPKLRRVVRLDSIPLTQAYYTDEGYLRDKPILTSTGIFEYKNPDGSVRRELRLPEEVFAKESLASYKAKPIIITHEAGLVTKDNVANEIVGTILSDGYRDGENVRADIVIHDTNAVKDRGYKELSLGYNLDLEETPGVWHGERYDAIQRNITINHLALVREARAGEQARLNIDSRDSETLKGGKSMKTTPKKTVRGDGILSKEELEQAIKEYKARRAKEAEKDEEPVASEPEPASKEKPDEKAAPAEKPAEEPAEKVEPTEKEKPAFDEDVDAVEKKPETVEEKIQKVKDNRNARDEEGDPKDKLSAMGMIAHQDEDIDTLFDIIDTLLAEREFNMKKDSDDDAIPDRDKKEANCDGDEEVEVEEEDEDFELDEDDEEEDPDEDSDDEPEEEVEVVEEFEEDEDDDASAFEEGEEDWVEDEDEWEDVEEESDEEAFATDSHDSAIPDSTGEVHHVKKLNSDSVDAVISERIALGMMGRKLNMDGLEKLGIMSAKKRIIKAVRPGIRLDGKSDAYINAAYDCAVDEIKKRSHKGVKYQKKQMFNKDSKTAFEESGPSSAAARQKMIERQTNRNK